jgi:hypothetical protein
MEKNPKLKIQIMNPKKVEIAFEYNVQGKRFVESWELDPAEIEKAPEDIGNLIRSMMVASRVKVKKKFIEGAA